MKRSIFRASVLRMHRYMYLLTTLLQTYLVIGSKFPHYILQVDDSLNTFEPTGTPRDIDKKPAIFSQSLRFSYILRNFMIR